MFLAADKGNEASRKSKTSLGGALNILTVVGNCAISMVRRLGNTDTSRRASVFEAVVRHLASRKSALSS